MSEKVEGTVILDGLVQGKIPALPGAEDRLHDWVRFAQSVHLTFHLEVTGGTFGLLADQAPIAVADLGDDPAATVKGALGELLKVFPPGERATVFSTLRGVEYRASEEVQTLYIVGPDGSVFARGRTVGAETVAARRPLSSRERAMQIAIGAVLLLLLLIASSWFIDYRGMFKSLRSQLRPLDAAHFPVDASVFEPYFTIEARSAPRDGQGLILTLHRGPLFVNPQAAPATQPASTQPSTQPAATQPVSAASSLAASAVASGYLRCEFFDETGQFMGFVFIRIKPLRDAETMQVEIPFSSDHRPSSVTLTY